MDRWQRVLGYVHPGDEHSSVDVLPKLLGALIHLLICLEPNDGIRKVHGLGCALLDPRRETSHMDGAHLGESC